MATWVVRQKANSMGIFVVLVFNSRNNLLKINIYVCGVGTRSHPDKTDSMHTVRLRVVALYTLNHLVFSLNYDSRLFSLSQLAPYTI